METKYLAVPDNTVARFFPGTSEKLYTDLYAENLTEQDVFIKIISAQSKVSLLNVKHGMLQHHLKERLEIEDQVLSGFNLVVHSAATKKELLEIKSQYFDKINKTIEAVNADRKHSLSTALSMQSKLIVFILDASTVTWHYCGLNRDAQFQDGPVNSHGSTQVLYRALLGVTPANIKYAEKQNILNTAVLCFGFKESDSIKSIEIYHRTKNLKEHVLYNHTKAVIGELFRSDSLITTIKLENHRLLELKNEQIEHVPFHYGLKYLSDLSDKNAANKSVGLKLVFNGSACLQLKAFTQQLALPLQLMLQLLSRETLSADAIIQLRTAASETCRAFKPKIDLFGTRMLTIAKNLMVVQQKIRELKRRGVQPSGLLKSISQKLKFWQMYCLEALQDPKVLSNLQFTLLPLREECIRLESYDSCGDIYKDIKSTFKWMDKTDVKEFPTNFAVYDSCRSLRIATKNYGTQLDLVLAYCIGAQDFLERFPAVLQNKNLNLSKVREFLGELKLEPSKAEGAADNDSNIDKLRELKSTANDELAKLKGVIGFNLADQQMLQRKHANLQIQAAQLQIQQSRLNDQIEDIDPSFKTKAKRCCRYRLQDTAYLFAVTSSKAGDYKKTSMTIAGATTTAGAYYFRNALFNLGSTGFNFVRGYGMMMIVPIIMLIMQSMGGGNRPNLR